MYTTNKKAAINTLKVVTKLIKDEAFVYKEKPSICFKINKTIIIPANHNKKFKKLSFILFNILTFP